MNEARAAIGFQEKRITLSQNGKNYIANSNDIWPVVHYGFLNAGEVARLDVSALRYFEPYLVVNESQNTTAKIEVDCGATLHFRGVGISPTIPNIRTVIVYPSEYAILQRLGGNTIHVFKPQEQTYWISGAGAKYRRLFDGTFEVIYFHTAFVPAGTTTTVSLPATLDVSTARVLSVTANPRPDGLDLPNDPPQVTGLGTTNGLSANQFNLRNPNGSGDIRNIVVHLVDVTEV